MSDSILDRLKSDLNGQWSARRKLEQRLIDRDREPIEAIREFVADAMDIVKIETGELFQFKHDRPQFSSDGAKTGFSIPIDQREVREKHFAALELRFVIEPEKIWFRGSRYDRDHLQSVFDKIAGCIHDRYSVDIQSYRWFDNTYESF